MKDISLKKEKLVEKIGLYFEDKRNLPPLGGRILALMLLSSEPGNSFDELAEMSKSSKGAVSTNLKLLLRNGTVECFTVCGDRKRYFRLSKNYLILNLKHHEADISEELEFLSTVEEFNKTYNQKKFEQSRDFVDIYKNFLKDTRDVLNISINKLNELEKNHS